MPAFPYPKDFENKIIRANNYLKDADGRVVPGDVIFFGHTIPVNCRFCVGLSGESGKRYCSSTDCFYGVNSHEKRVGRMKRNLSHSNKRE